MVGELVSVAPLMSERRARRCVADGAFSLSFARSSDRPLRLSGRACVEDGTVESLDRIPETSDGREELPVNASGSGESFQVLRTDGSDVETMFVSLQRRWRMWELDYAPAPPVGSPAFERSFFGCTLSLNFSFAGFLSFKISTMSCSVSWVLVQIV